MSSAQETASDITADTQPTPLTPPHTRRRVKRRRPRVHLDHCLNCGRMIEAHDNFCPECGQKNEDETVPLRFLVSDFLSEIASWDSKLFRTVLPLLFRPGFLTDEFLAGRRIRYLSPLKMYLVISAVFFLVLPTSHFGDHVHVNPYKISVHASPAVHTRPAVNARPESSRPQGQIQINEYEASLDALPATTAAYDAEQHDPHNPHHDGFGRQLIMRQIIKARQDKETFAQSLAQGLMGDLPKMMFVLLPLFALLLKITYWRRRRLYVEHLIFSLHSHAFLFILLTPAALASRPGIDSTVVWTTCGVVMAVYLLAALRRVYKQSWPKTSVKFLWLAFNYFILLFFAFLATATAAFLMA